MVSDILIEQLQMKLEDGEQVCLQYYVTKEAVENCRNVYGIKVEKQGEETETEFTGPISQSEDWVIRICRLIAGNQVTPIGLINVVDDIITGY